LGGIVNNVAYFMFVLIFVLLVVSNYQGAAAVMSSTGTTISEVTYTLQGGYFKGGTSPTGVKGK
jgi:hypothetical protein